MLLPAIPTQQPEILFYRPIDTECVTLRVYGSSVPAGFPSPAADYIMEEIDLGKELIPKPLSTFVVRVTGDSMIDAHIPPQSRLVVDRSLKPRNNSIVVAVVNGEFTVKRFFKNSSGIRLMPANKKYHPIPITEGMEFSVWGIVTQILIDPIKCEV
jgi:DNA polymerase V